MLKHLHFTKFLGFLLFTLLGLPAAMAQTGSIKGKVQSKDGTLLPAATVSIAESNTKVQTNTLGAYEIANIKTGVYKITAKFLGMPSETKQISVAEGETTTLNFFLNDANNQLNEVEIAASYRRFGKKESDQVAKLPLKNLENP